MASTQIVIVYSLSQNKRRRVIIPDDDSQVSAHLANIVNGEAAIAGSIADYNTIGPDAILFKHTGKQPADDRCIVHDGVSVKAVICADPLIDTHHLGTVAIDTTGKAFVGAAINKGVAVIPIPVLTDTVITPRLQTKIDNANAMIADALKAGDTL